MTKKKVGRPRKEIDFKVLKNLCGIQATLIECAAILECSEDTIERRVVEKYKITFKEYWEINSANGRASLRRAQFKAALSGNTTMMIWLGKQYLQQTDKSAIDLDVPDLKNRKFNLNFKSYPKNKK